MKWRTSAATVVCVALLSLGGSPPAEAGGLLGDIINKVIPGAGTQLDEAHRRIKEAIPPYKMIEEGTSKVVNETLVQTGAPALQEAIARSRDDALRNGVQPIPPLIRQNLSGFISERILSIARYRVQGGGDLTLQVNAIRYGEAEAITLDYVIVFKQTNNALYNPTLWAHELTHINQYQSWGLRDFSIRYLRDSGGVEREAYEAETRYVAWAGLQNTRGPSAAGRDFRPADVNRPLYQFGSQGMSSLCGTAVTACRVNGSAPVGSACWCNTRWGAATGSLLPDGSTQNFPPPPPPPPPPVPANACVTARGSCALGIAMGVGSPCTCFSPQGNFAGVAQRRSLGGTCMTQAGNCMLASPLFSGDPCYCPTMMGPVWGRVP